MGILSGLRDSLFGDSGKAGQKSQKRENEKNRDFIRESTDMARADINTLFPQAAEARLGGFQGAQDIFASAVPQQFNAFQQGNQQAQATTGMAPQQIQNALLGLPVDFGFLQPQQVQQPDFSFLNQPLQPQAQQQPVQQPQFQLPQGFNPFNIGIGNEGGGVNLSQGSGSAGNFDINQLFGIDPLTGQPAINPQTGLPLDINQIFGGSA